MSLECLIDRTDSPLPPDALYTQIAFPDPPADRPYLYINMAATVDGKIVLGEPGGSAKGVGGPTDQLLFRRLQGLCDAALLGSATLRASNVLYPPEKPRFVVTRQGDVPLHNRFFTDAPDRAFVLAPQDLPQEPRKRLVEGTHLIQVGHGSVDLSATMRLMRQAHGIRYLLCEGGGALNDELFRAGLVDEFFLTLTPKIKGGAPLPTVVGGEGFAPKHYAPLELLSLYQDGDEMYFRYRVGAERMVEHVER